MRDLVDLQLISVVGPAVSSIQNPAAHLLKKVGLATVATCEDLVPWIGLATVGVVFLLAAVTEAARAIVILNGPSDQ